MCMVWELRRLIVFCNFMVGPNILSLLAESSVASEMKWFPGPLLQLREHIQTTLKMLLMYSVVIPIMVSSSHAPQ